MPTTITTITPTQRMRVVSAIQFAKAAHGRAKVGATVYWLECARDSAMAFGMHGVAGDIQVALEELHAEHGGEGYVWSGLSANTVVEV